MAKRKCPKPRAKKPKLQVTRNDALWSAASLFCKSQGYPLPVGGEDEIKFAEEMGRKYAFDCAWPDQKIAIEFQGGGERGRHQKFRGYNNDVLKLAHAAALGWRVYYVTTHQATKGMHYLLMDFEFGGRDLAKLAKGLLDVSAFYRAKPKAKSKGIPRSLRDQLLQAGRGVVGKKRGGKS